MHFSNAALLPKVVQNYNLRLAGEFWSPEAGPKQNIILGCGGDVAGHFSKFLENSKLSSTVCIFNFAFLRVLLSVSLLQLFHCTLCILKEICSVSGCLHYQWDLRWWNASPWFQTITSGKLEKNLWYAPFLDPIRASSSILVSGCSPVVIAVYCQNFFP